MLYTVVTRVIWKDASSSDTELHRTSPLWPPRPRSPPEHTGPRIPRAPIVPIDPSLSDSARSISSQEADDAAKGLFCLECFKYHKKNWFVSSFSLLDLLFKFCFSCWRISSKKDESKAKFNEASSVSGDLLLETEGKKSARSSRKGGGKSAGDTLYTTATPAMRGWWIVLHSDWNGKLSVFFIKQFFFDTFWCVLQLIQLEDVRKNVQSKTNNQ